MSTTIIKCKLSIDLLLSNYFLRKDDKCSSCLQFIALHLYEKELEKKINESNVYVRDVDIKIKDNLNYEYKQLASPDDSFSQLDISSSSLSSNFNVSKSYQDFETTSEESVFLCKKFLKKHYCSRIESNNFEELYVRILSMIKDTNRVYYLMKHARHSCLGLVKATNNDDQLLTLFQFLNDFLP